MKLITFCTLYIIFAFTAAYSIGLFEIPDAYFYYVLGHFLLTGNLLPVAPLNALVPQTLFAPIYAILSYPFVYLAPGPQFYIPFFQLILIGISALCVFISVKRFLPKTSQYVSVILFFLLPFNLLYAFVFMSEVVTLFFVSLSLLILTRVKPILFKWSLMVLLSAVLSLTRYAFMPWIVISLIGFGVSIVIQIRKRTQKNVPVLTVVPVLIGVLLIISWIAFNMHWYKRPMLSSFTGRHIYNNVITAGKLIPQNSKDPHVSSFVSYIPKDADLARPWWDMQPYFAQPFYEQKLTEVQIDSLFLNYSIAGIKEHPLQYIIHIAILVFKTPNTPPYFDNVLTQLGYEEPNCLICNLKPCRFMWIPNYCKPLNEKTFTNNLFVSAIRINLLFYPFITSLLLILSLLGILTIFISKNKILILISILFITQHVFQSASEWIEGRFLLPLYPFYVVTIVYGILGLKKLIKKGFEVFKLNN